jgi:hypothetical protein
VHRRGVDARRAAVEPLPARRRARRPRARGPWGEARLQARRELLAALQPHRQTRMDLRPRRRGHYECLELELAETRALSDGWRVDNRTDWIFHRRDGRGVDFSKVCPEEHPPYLQPRHRSPPRVHVTCEGDPSVWMVWTPPDHVEKLDAEFARKANGPQHYLMPYTAIDRYAIGGDLPTEVHTILDEEHLVRELIGKAAGPVRVSSFASRDALPSQPRCRCPFARSEGATSHCPSTTVRL